MVFCHVRADTGRTGAQSLAPAAVGLPLLLACRYARPGAGMPGMLWRPCSSGACLYETRDFLGVGQANCPFNTAKRQVR
jgi:hypothetical protein